MMKVYTYKTFIFSLFVFLQLLFVNTNIAQTEKKLQRQPDLISLIHQTAINEGIPPKLFESLVRVESRGYLCTTSPKNARGIVQLIPSTARRFGLRVDAQIDERCNAFKSLTAGARYLKWLYDLFKDYRLALAGYNAGEGAVIKYARRIPPYKETIQYVEKICALTYGKTGLGLELAYNPQQAYFLVNALYRGRHSIGTPSLQNLQNQNLALTVPTVSSRPVNNQAPDESNQVEKNESPPRKTIRVTEIEPRIATRTLSFYREN